ncbi:hypothetical protein [Marinomonas mediterranea]|uniref:hypothetical protein n=1 Tax=Marinomonas mediterranea TaxID=119864 RepID=UPI0011D22F0F|nr:hypothetical protein [Marinomonas mediterranea]WCN16704.1 hypothetical protein GV053_06335 [Marinomonas mediterranea MMB-1]
MPQQIMQRWQIVQGQLIRALHQEIGLLTDNPPLLNCIKKERIIVEGRHWKHYLMEKRSGKKRI